MTDTDIKTAILTCLARIAPEADPALLAPDANIREELDIDSFDFLRFLIALSGKLGMEIPEADYAKLSTLAGISAYLATSSAKA